MQMTLMMTILLLHGEYFIRKALVMITIYEKGSGSKLNMDKTKGMWPGFKASQTTGQDDIQWINDKLKLLGITFGSDSAVLTSWRERVYKLEKCLNMWQHGELSFPGKVLILDTLGLSDLVYLGSVQTIPIPCLQPINKVIFNFLWSGKTQLINRSIAPEGHRITDMKTKLPALQLKWLQSITNPLLEDTWVYLLVIGLVLGANNKPHFDLLIPPPPPPEILPAPFRISTQTKT